MGPITSLLTGLGFLLLAPPIATVTGAGAMILGIAGIGLLAWAAILALRKAKPPTQGIGASNDLQDPSGRQSTDEPQDVTIGTYSTDGLAAAIRAQIVHGDRVQPDVDRFLERLSLGDPYCANEDCSRTFSVVQVCTAVYTRTLYKLIEDTTGIWLGYKCYDCGTVIPKSYDTLRRETEGEVRRNYGLYWTKYQEEIRRLGR